jgi:hypothetical protein
MEYLDWLWGDGSGEDKPRRDIGAVSELLDSEPIYVSQAFSSFEPSNELNDLMEGDSLELENRSVKKFNARNREHRVYNGREIGIDAPMIQLVVPDPGDLDEYFRDMDIDVPVYLRTAFRNHGEPERTENVYAFDTQDLYHELINLKHITSRSELGKTGMQQVVSANNLLEEAERSYKEVVDSEY